VIVLAAFLTAIGLGDLTSSLSGRPENTVRAIVGIIVGAGSSFVLLATSGPMSRAVVAGVLITVAVALWQLLRLSDTAWTPAGALPALAALILPLAVAIAVSESFPEVDGLVREIVDRLPAGAVGSRSPDTVVLTLAIVIALISTGNAVVRLALAGIGTPVASSETRLRGGRLIGPLERVLIFGLALAGEPTAAALVISAKGLLRFPELSDLRNQQEPPGEGGVRRIDEVTEYLLVGSLVSWVVALAPVVLV
jgi:hypothetical protein